MGNAVETLEKVERPPFVPVINEVMDLIIYANWGAKDWGFGQIYVKSKGEEITIDNECMSMESIRSILHALADYIADNGVLLDDKS